jgi:hypothetical protein
MNALRDNKHILDMVARELLEKSRLTGLVRYVSFMLNTKLPILVSLAQLVGTMHNICKVRCSNPGHHQKNTKLPERVSNEELFCKMFNGGLIIMHIPTLPQV